MLKLENEFKQHAKFKVIGIGGGGCNALNRIIEESADLEGIEFIAVNTDVQVLNNSNADVKIQIGKNITKGLGTGADPEIGRKAVEENLSEIKEQLKETDKVYNVTLLKFKY